MTDDKKAKPLTRAQRKLVDASVLIFGEAATKNDAASMARELVQASLPRIPEAGRIPETTKAHAPVRVCAFGSHHFGQFGASLLELPSQLSES